MVIRTNEFDTNYENYLYSTINDAFEHNVKSLIDTKVSDLKIYGFVTKEPVKFENRLEGTYKEFQINEPWGKLFECAWFRLEGKIANYNAKENYYLKLDLAGEAAIFDKSGTPLKGFTNGSSAFDRVLGEPGKLYYKINDLVNKDGSLLLWVEAGANDLFGNLSEEGRIQVVEVVTRNEEAQELYYDFETLYSLLGVIDKSTDRYIELLRKMLEAAHLVIYEEENYLQKAKAVFAKLLSKNTSNNGEFFAIGHGHMDLAWLWPIRETRRKVGRLFANVTDNLDRHPNYIFGVSQPQMLVWLKEDYPHLFDKVKKYVKEGRIELQGGMWVESDTNLASGEALTRQMLYGVKYFENEFGFKVRNLWLPDVFGYSGNLPQIIKQSGLDYFMTIKISWNLVNQFPYHTFNWEGIDGTKVFTHMPPEGTYNSPSFASRNYNGWNNYREKEVAPEALIVYGIGNGGGGPGDEHLARIDRQNNLDPLPKIKYSRADDFFESLKKYKEKVPTYKGELYLENHQGTYTSQANVKKMNRLMEEKLKTLEIVLTLSNKFDSFKEEIKKMWEEVLLYQFHDILPGSSIKRVYDECLVRYDELSDQVNDILRRAFVNFEDEVTDSSYILNPLNHNHRHVRKVNDKYLVYNLKAYGSVQADEKHLKEEYLKLNFETNNLIITLDEKTGFINSMLHKPTSKELVKDKFMNELLVYRDLGDAWNIRDHYREQTPTQMKLGKMSVNKYGSFYEIVQNYTFKKSSLTQTIVIDTITDNITFEHNLDWKDLGYMFRTSSSINIETDKAHFDIQYGELTRARTNHNSIDSAQFEVPGQQWVSINDNELSFSIINNAKYGFYVKDDILDMNLLRSTNYPAEDGDLDQTNYKYQFVVREGNHQENLIDTLGIEFNTFYPSFSIEIKLEELLTYNKDNIIISAIKKAEDDNAIIVRLYERDGVSTKVNLNFSDSVEKVLLTNMVEDNIEQLNSFDISFGGFEVKNFKLYIK